MRPGHQFFFALVMIAVAAQMVAATPANAQLTQRTLQYQGSTRTWFEHLPAGYDGSHSVPLVVSLHGYNNSGSEFAADSGWAAVADSGGFIVVFPNGGLTVDGDFGWNNFVFDGSAPDDVGFLLALINQLEADYRVDAKRIFMNGFSNGAGMTNNFVGVHGTVLAGIGAVSGGWLTGFDVPVSDMQPGGPLPVWVWGNNDGDNFQNGSETLAQEEQDQLQWWLGYDGNGTTPATTSNSPYTTSIYPGGGAEVRYTEYLSHSHAFQPGTAQMLWTDFFSTLSKGTTHTGQAPVVTSAGTATATTGNVFSYQITATNNPTLYGEASIPSGLTINQSTGKITGAPTKTGTFAAKVAAFNTAGSALKNLTITVKAGAPVITSALKASGKAGITFNYQITASNSPTKYGEGDLPAGLRIDQTTGKITGVPAAAGTFSVTIAAFNAVGSGSAKLALTVAPAAPVITSSLKATGKVGTAFAYQIAATNSPTKYGEGSLPAGLTINQATGKITGTPTKTGSYNVTIAAFNATGSGSAKLALNIQ